METDDTVSREKKDPSGRTSFGVDALAARIREKFLNCRVSATTFVVGWTALGL